MDNTHYCDCCMTRATTYGVHRRKPYRRPRYRYSCDDHARTRGLKRAMLRTVKWFITPTLYGG